RIMRIERELTIEAAPEEVWRILADDYEKVGEWARAVTSSAPNADAAPLPGATVGGRVCSASIGEVTETIRVFDAEQKVLAYDAQSKAMPFFVRNLSGNWTIVPSGGVSKVGLQFEADLMAPFSALMGWVMKRQFRTAIDDTLEDLKLYAETGEVHPDKARALAAMSQAQPA
ncbi:MAG: SRPBCC family protein, partial [Pseudomonadota bacterium]